MLMRISAISHNEFPFYFLLIFLCSNHSLGKFLFCKDQNHGKRHAKLLLMRCISWFLCDYVMRSLHNRSTAPRNFANTYSRFPTFYDYSRNIKANIIKTCRTPGDNDPLPTAQKRTTSSLRRGSFFIAPGTPSRNRTCN